MKYTLDLSGHDNDGKASVDRIGGLFMSVEDAVTHGRTSAGEGRFVFRPEVLWVRVEEGKVLVQDNI